MSLFSLLLLQYTIVYIIVVINGTWSRPPCVCVYTYIYIYMQHAGDIMCFHNYRVLHARSEFVIPSTSEGGMNVERHLVGGYFDWAEMLSKRRVLRRILKLYDDPEV